MKVDLITLHAVKNYGSVLQAFATQEKFKEYGCDVRILNYIRPDVTDENLMTTWCGNNLLKKIVLLPSFYRWKKIFGGFIRDYLNLSDKVFSNEDDFIDFQSDADIYCTGSDQVWNSGWNNGVIKPLYLNFAPENSRKFAYAASFGNSVLSENEVAQTKELIEKYDYISVREESGLGILEEQYMFKKSCQIIDPTLVMPASFWRKYTKKPKIDGDYVLVYQLNNNKLFDKFAAEFAKKNKLKLIRFCTRYDQIIKNGKSILIPEMFDFVSLIDNARYVITDSLHATAFSINLNTEPVCIYPQNYGSRIESLLNLFEIGSRHLKDYNDFDIVNRQIDFSKVNQILDRERIKVDAFLKMVLLEPKKSIEKWIK
ncbi:polysaccharide pyruvyl transferase family protein [Paenibacillus roseipurpureus]|uniref:Polysaccharide pyruvyl transferase family protein n=1 Tax=Paenibacillus roseopurpureus TaxID=2918901 RepID=A0AA96RJT3_9BACL|nr:polysaccharide pyruvyl transferase family protein [Paenibacillus sp. MBLB1832]WNR43506.1 polysaccharide pyruvyl transferase family protein [Paenibacillus sp. MBLB1832]